MVILNDVAVTDEAPLSDGGFGVVVICTAGIFTVTPEPLPTSTVGDRNVNVSVCDERLTLHPPVTVGDCTAAVIVCPEWLTVAPPETEGTGCESVVLSAEMLTVTLVPPDEFI